MHSFSLFKIRPSAYYPYSMNISMKLTYKAFRASMNAVLTHGNFQTIFQLANKGCVFH